MNSMTGCNLISGTNSIDSRTKMGRLGVTEDDIGLKVLHEPPKPETSDPSTQIIECNSPLSILEPFLRRVTVSLPSTVSALTRTIRGAKMSARDRNMSTGLKMPRCYHQWFRTRESYDTDTILNGSEPMQSVRRLLHLQVASYWL